MEPLQDESTPVQEIFLVIASIVHCNRQFADHVRVAHIPEVNDARHRLVNRQDVQFVHIVLNHLPSKFVLARHYVFFILSQKFS